MALGFLKIAASIGRGVGKFIQNRRAKKEAKIEAKATKLAEQRAKLAELAGIDTANGGEPVGSIADYIKASGAISSMPEKAPPVKVASAKTSQGSESKSMPVWLWPVAIAGMLFLLPKILSSRK
jgi:uncharacterized protein YpmB